MNCPICKSETIVLRTDVDRRRRACTNSKCGHRFTTVEVLKAEHERRETLIQDAAELAGKLAAGA